MKRPPSKTERLHSLDSLRAIMMMLGIVIHSAITYGVSDYGDSWSLKDPEATHISNDFIVSFIHAFRMQAFFLVAGFFGSMLFYERSPLRMTKNRFFRIVLPFIVFLILLWPTIRFGFTYTNLVFANAANPFDQAISIFSSIESFIPPRTFHLWFLYYLGIITFVSTGLGLIFQQLPGISGRISKTFEWIIQRPLVRILVFGGVMSIVYFIMGTWAVDTSTSFVLDFNTFLYYFTFYIIGWVLFKSKHHLSSIMRYDWTCTILGLILFSIHFFMYDSFSFFAHVGIKSLFVWLFIFGITGLFIRYASNHSPLMRYISDSSYWVYLVHLTLTALIPSAIVDWPIPPTLKFLVVLSVTGVICFVSYHYLVRATFIGKFLNGRKYSRKIKETPLVEKVALEGAN